MNNVKLKKLPNQAARGKTGSKAQIGAKTISSQSLEFILFY